MDKSSQNPSKRSRNNGSEFECATLTGSKKKAVTLCEASCSKSSPSEKPQKRTTDKKAEKGNKRLLFWPTDELHYIRETLEKSKEEKLDLEFHILELFRIPKKTWEVCGSKVRSVTWYSAQPMRNYETSSDEDSRRNRWGSSDESDGTDSSCDEYLSKQAEYRNIQEKYSDVWWSIFSHCEHLEYFDHRSGYCDDEYYKETVLSKNLLQKLVNGNIVREQVQTLTKGISLHELESEEVFKVFPNIRKICIYDEEKEEFSRDYSKIPGSVNQVTFGSSLVFLSYLKSPHVNIKLKELKAEIKIQDNDVCKLLLQFFTQLNELEVLDLNVCLEKECKVGAFKAELIIQILRSCDNLTKFIIGFEDKSKENGTQKKRSSFDKNVVERILRLNTIKIFGFNITDLLPSTISVEGNVQCFRIPGTDSQFVQLLKCNAFKNIACLDIMSTDIDDLKTISKFQLNLKTLKIGSLTETDYYDNEPTERELQERLSKLKTIPAISFQKLEHLELEEGIYMLLIIFSEFHFPSLKHLAVTEVDRFEALWNIQETARENMPEILGCLSQRAPLLEIFHCDIIFNWKRELHSNCVTFIKQMKKLEIFSFDVDGSQYPMTTKEIEKVYKMRRTLKLVINSYLRFYNRQTRKMVTVSEKGDHYTNYIFKKGECCTFLL